MKQVRGSMDVSSFALLCTWVPGSIPGHSLGIPVFLLHLKLDQNDLKTAWSRGPSLVYGLFIYSFCLHVQLQGESALKPNLNISLSYYLKAIYTSVINISILNQIICETQKLYRNLCKSCGSLGVNQNI